MTAVLTFDIPVSQYTDTIVIPIWIAGGLPVSYAGASATLMSRVSPGDVSPALSISTTQNASGVLVFGPSTTSLVTVPAGGVAIVIFNAWAAANAPLLSAYDCSILWANGTKTPFATGFVRLTAGNNH